MCVPRFFIFNVYLFFSLFSATNHLTSCLEHIVDNKQMKIDRPSDVTIQNGAQHNDVIEQVFATDAEYVVSVAKQCCASGCHDNDVLKRFLQ